MHKAIKGSHCIDYGFADELTEVVQRLFTPVGELTGIDSDGFTLTGTLELNDEAYMRTVNLSTRRVAIEHTSVPRNLKVTIDLTKAFEYSYRTTGEAIERLMPEIQNEVTRHITRWIQSF